MCADGPDALDTLRSGPAIRQSPTPAAASPPAASPSAGPDRARFISGPSGLVDTFDSPNIHVFSYPTRLECVVTSNEVAWAQIAKALTAQFEDMPASHTSSASTFRLAFSEAVEVGCAELCDEALEVTGAR